MFGISVFPSFFTFSIGPVVKPSVSTCFVKSGVSICVDFTAPVVLLSTVDSCDLYSVLSPGTVNIVCLGEVSWSVTIWAVVWFSCRDVTYIEVGVAVVVVDVVSGAENTTNNLVNLWHIVN